MQYAYTALDAHAYAHATRHTHAYASPSHIMITMQ